MRTMNIEKLIKTLPIIQNQLDALLDFQVLEPTSSPQAPPHHALSPPLCVSVSLPDQS